MNDANEIPSALYPRLRWENHLPIDYSVMRGDSYRFLNEVREEIMPTFLDASKQRFREQLVRNSRCLVCDASQFEEVFWKEGLRFVKCLACELVQVNPVPIESVADSFYSSEAYNRIIKLHTIDNSDYRRKRFATERVQAWDELLGPAKTSAARAILDVGCANGFVLDVAQQHGWRACGVDLNPAAVENARTRGLDVRLGKLEACDFSNGSFDVVTMYDLLEHVYNPRDLLKRAFELTRTGGILVLYVPNYDSLTRLVLGKETFWIWGIFHLSYFTATTLGRAVRNAGYHIEGLESHGMDIPDLIWREENRGPGRSMEFLREHSEAFQFAINASGWGGALRLYARKPD